ncbi:MAG TPA: thioredoxin family protein [Polyangia bacterium]|jgi:peroxiredoxin|nr:thioredoxin family protein [Polyangia bacterium]
MAIETPPASLGVPCPPFRLPAVDGKSYGLRDFDQSPVLVVMFICNHCPYVQAVEDRLVRLAHDLGPRGAAFVGVCSNDAVSYPDDAFDKLAERWHRKGYGFPYLHDQDQDMARAFGAVCTPDIFVFDADRRLAYRGRIDDSWKDESKVTRRELSEAIAALLAGRRPAAEQRPSMGCSIKWKQ